MSIFHRSSYCIFLSVVLAAACYGQNMTSLNVFEGEVRGQVHGAQSVELIDAKTQDMASRSLVGSDGTFVIHDVTPGAYVVRVVPNSQNGTARTEEYEISVDGEKKPGSKPITGTVSAQNLAKPPSKSALKFLKKAQRYSEAGESAKAIEVLRSAPLDPAGAPYVHSRLGTEYLKTRQYALAVPELEEAARLLPREPAHHSNLAYVYQILGQLEQAEKEARIALQLDGANTKAHFLLGSILLDRPAGLPESVVNLKLAAGDLPSARFLLGEAYALSGQREAGQREINRFMADSTEAQQAAARAWIARHTPSGGAGRKPAAQEARAR